MIQIRALLIIFILFLSGCEKLHNNGEVESTYIDVVVDTTTIPLFIYPEADAILGLYGFENNLLQEASFRFTTISDYRLNAFFECHLADEATTEKNNTREDQNYREQVVLNFFDTVRNAISRFNIKCLSAHSSQYSECFATIAGELKLLAKSSAHKKILIVYSDLEENSALFNCYDTTVQYLLWQSPKRIADSFERAGQLPKSLDRVHIIFVYKPRNRADESLYLHIVEVYQLLLESKGATISIQSTGSFFKI